jgi:hypothetical protein
MTDSFFPEPEPAPEPVASVPQPWFQPPADEYPVRVLIRGFLVQSAGTVLSVSYVDVYSTGLSIKVDWELRRVGESLLDWQVASGMGLFHNGGDESGRRFGLALANGTVVTTVDRRRVPAGFGQEPEGWSLMDHGGGGGGGDTRYSGSNRLWLWPLPPPGPIELVGEWRARGIAQSRLVLDANPLLAAVDGVRPLWPE